MGKKKSDIVIGEVGLHDLLIVNEFLVYYRICASMNLVQKIKLVAQ